MGKFTHCLGKFVASIFVEINQSFTSNIIVMNRKQKIMAIASVLVSGVGGVAHEALKNDAHAQSYSFYCCEGWGRACGTICINVPGQTEKWWLA